MKNLYWKGKGAALPFEHGIISGFRSVCELLEFEFFFLH